MYLMYQPCFLHRVSAGRFPGRVVNDNRRTGDPFCASLHLLSNVPHFFLGYKAAQDLIRGQQKFWLHGVGDFSAVIEGG